MAITKPNDASPIDVPATISGLAAGAATLAGMAYQSYQKNISDLPFDNVRDFREAMSHVHEKLKDNIPLSTAEERIREANQNFVNDRPLIHISSALAALAVGTVVHQLTHRDEPDTQVQQVEDLSRITTPADKKREL